MMKTVTVFDVETGKNVAEITTNHSMSIDDALANYHLSVDDDGRIVDDDTGERLDAWYETLAMKWEV